MLTQPTHSKLKTTEQTLFGDFFFPPRKPTSVMKSNAIWLMYVKTLNQYWANTIEHWANVESNIFGSNYNFAHGELRWANVKHGPNVGLP